MNTTRTTFTGADGSYSRVRLLRQKGNGDRFRAVLEIAGLVVVALLLLLGILPGGTEGRVPVETTQVCAEAGDSLWAIAQAHPVEGRTTAETVELIISLNHLESPHVITGGALEVPLMTTNLAVASK